MKNSNDLLYSMSKKNPKQNKLLRFKEDHKTNSSSSFKSYTNRLLLTQVISFVILFMACVLQLVAVCTNDWFYLNATTTTTTNTKAKGGLWSFCSISSSTSTFTFYSNNFNFYNNFNNNGVGVDVGVGGQSSPCMPYEQYGLILNQFERLNSSRILLVFTLCLFILVLVCLDVTWCFLCVSLNCCRFFKTNKFKAPQSTTIDHSRPFSSKCRRLWLLKRRKLSYDISKQHYYYYYPRYGYCLYLIFATISLLFMFIGIILQITGFGLFESFIQAITLSISSSTNMSPTRGYSYWLMIASILFTLTYFCIKLFCLCYIVKLTKGLKAMEKVMMSKSTPTSMMTNENNLVNMNYSIDNETKNGAYETKCNSNIFFALN
jgi:hypothetical protein